VGPAADRGNLAYRYATLLMIQGIGHTLDLWGGEAMLQHASVEALTEHLRWYLTPLDFELPCELASAAVGLDATARATLVRAGGDLGLAWHCTLARARLSRPLAASAPPLRWQALASGSLPQALQQVSEKARGDALLAARRLAPAVADVFEQLLEETLSHAVVETA
jgi:hypothetical protein